MATPKFITWSPHPDRNQFLVGGAELKLYEWIPETDDQPAKTHFISSVPSETLMMCADWSPDPNCPDMIAVGLTTGKTVLVSMQDNVHPETYPASEGAHTPTNAFRPITNNNNHQSAQEYPTLSAKMSRPCNVVSFSKSHPNLLATGLEKARNFPCLLVWDASQAMDSYSSTPTGTQTPTAQYFPRQRPVDIRSATTSSWRPELSHNRNSDSIIQDSIFDKSKITATVNPDQGIPIKGSTSNREQTPIQQYGPAENTVSCTWSVHSHSPLLIAGMGSRYLRVYDIRVDSGANPLQFSTKAVHGTIVDPFNPYRIASHTEEGVVKIWDIRKTTDSISFYICFSPSRQGSLAILSKDSSTVQLWDIQETSSLQSVISSDVRSSPIQTAFDASGMSASRSSRLGSQTPRGIRSLVSQKDDTISTPVLWKSRRTNTSSRPLSSFTFIPPSVPGMPSSTSQRILAMNREGHLETIRLQEAAEMTWKPTGGMMISKGNDLLAYDATLPSVEETTQQMSKLRLHGFGELHNERMHMRSGPMMEQAIGEELHMRKVLSKDISVVMRKRVGLGYSMDCAKNSEIIKTDDTLHELWTWLDRAERMSKGTAQIGNIDYSFQGVYGIWMGPGSQGRKASPASTPRLGNSQMQARQPPQKQNRGMAPENDTQANSGAVPDENDLGMVSTAKLAQRRLALKVCGFGFNPAELESQLVRLESRGEYDKAAGWALFHGIPERAIRALRSERGLERDETDQQRKLISAVLAGYQPNASNINPTWRELCESLSRDMLDRPYLRAIFAYIASNDWFKVLDDPGLPLRERMAIALRVLNDDQMTLYLNRSVEQLVQDGDVEGVVVTGLTSRGVDLLEQALDHYGDVQTASLVMSFVVPRRFKDKRVEDWVESYRTLLDRWQLWHPRARFDIERGKYMNSSEIAPPQIYVRCTFCAQSLGHSLLIQNVRNREGKRMNVQTNVSPASGGRISGKQKSTVCPSCRKLLPRCALCLLHMGTPIDSLRQAIAANDVHKVDPAGFDLWFTWCQTCRHGGHAVHMEDWFQKHSTCPVSNCICQCKLEP
ncbi:hypothetical protein PHYBLDRAFT_182399 [Phycomyces blakesleeanus NRRL 1555(-)]|uniref:Uncharacterized protein n=2 Tax=Phycomyces blakesleeanus TaxID=4837 RepID=A0A167LHG5_PHYB8|nr:hypothetical protein PHYBLDRAFT_182399 [Phycomyces blakesleeanus NRRL 1555(-)]OAD70468.1 hypothetical protein PHYBLDRAFT_182399 [Phycomyces blakesleeanus NRRL 1555(-)]|eukprot:XP_018288508.1 hypothetical protein PHYBLDRAFT_182399 [Phycomyces blakesleeanus NRRL 1555(-)]